MIKTKIFKLTTLIALLLVLAGGFVSCRKQITKKEYDIYKNHNISACGVNDPLRNIEWLKEYCESINETQDVLSVHINLYKVIGTVENIFQIGVPSPIEYAPNQYYSTLYFRDCNGDTVFQWKTITPPGGLYDDFMKDKEFAAKLFHYVKQ
jgi:hypothetical protein